MAGPYGMVKLSNNLFLHGRAAWGTSSNDVSPFMTYTDHFDSDRWLVSSSLIGRWNYGPWWFKPQASIAYMEDKASSYTDTFGNLIPEVTSRLGQAKAGPEVSYQLQYNRNTIIEPRVGAQVIWNFDAENSAAGLGQLNGDPGATGVRGRVEAGFRVMSPSGGATVDISGSYDGIGSSDYHALSGRAGVRFPLN